MFYEIVESRKAEDENLSFCKDTIQLKGGIESAFLALGERLYRIREKKLYLPQWETLDVFLEEMKISETTGSKLIHIYERFVLEFAIPEQKLVAAGGWSILAELLPYVKEKEKADEVIDLCANWSRAHVRQWIREQKTGVTEENCTHPEIYFLRVCPQCGQKVRVEKEEAYE